MNKLINVFGLVLTVASLIGGLNVMSETQAAITDPTVIACTTDIECEELNPSIEFSMITE